MELKKLIDEIIILRKSDRSIVSVSNSKEFNENKDTSYLQYLLKTYYNLLNESKSGKWLFRGQSNSEWPLEDTLWRAIKKYTDEKVNYFELEKNIIKEFKRKSPQYLNKIPKEENIFEWLSLLRHFQAPCRLLDFNYSFFVALLFAIEEIVINQDPTNNKGCAIYAINNDLFDVEKLTFKDKKNDIIIKDKIRNTSEDSDKIICEHIFNEKNKKEFVFNISPFILNERITIQQGTFLCRWNIKESFEQNLIGNLIKNNLLDYSKKYIKKYILIMDKKDRNEIINDLHRMNVNLATLYPGLEGFAKSLKMRIEFNI